MWRPNPSQRPCGVEEHKMKLCFFRMPFSARRSAQPPLQSPIRGIVSWWDAGSRYQPPCPVRQHAHTSSVPVDFPPPIRNLGSASNRPGAPIPETMAAEPVRRRPPFERRLCETSRASTELNLSAAPLGNRAGLRSSFYLNPHNRQAASAARLQVGTPSICGEIAESAWRPCQSDAVVPAKPIPAAMR